MLAKRRGFLGYFGAVLAATFLPGGALAATVAHASQDGLTLDGSWLLTTLLPTGARGAGLLTCTPDGGFVRSGDGHPLESPGHGAWERTGDREFNITYVALRFDADRNFIGSRKTNVRLTLDETLEAFTGQSSSTVYDREGNITGTGGVPLEGTRIRVEPFA